MYMSFFGSGDVGGFDKTKYERLTMSIRQTVLERAHNRCQKCSVKFSPKIHPQFEHINGSTKDNRPTNLRALCPECFKDVEKKEKTGGVLGGLSRLVKGVPVDLKK
jgi:5-methylcytosine-specific restriction endonuclease McrA